MSVCALSPAMFPRLAAGFGTAAFMTVAAAPAPWPPRGPKERALALVRSATRLGRSLLPQRVSRPTYLH